MSAGSNGLTPIENLDQRRKCPINPTKARFTERAAHAEARARAERTGLPIEPYLCEGCGFWHLTKSSRGTARLKRGKYTTGDLRVLAPTHPVFSGADMPDDSPAIPGNRLARLRVLSRWLEANADVTPTSAELTELLGGTLSRDTLRSLMRELGYRNTGGRSARWVPDIMSEPEPPHTPPQEAVSTWLDVDAERVGALAVADVIAAYEAIGLHVRIQVRPHG